MAEKPQNPGAVTNIFNKGMLKDLNETFVGEGLWTHARNAVNNNHDGQLGVIGNEPANLHCVTLPYPLIGAVHITDDQWALFLTDDVNSEIGLFDESSCTYTRKINDKCLNFKRSNPITGISRRRFDCERPVYFVDGINPDRFVDLDNPPFKYTETFENGCSVKKFSTEIDCERLRLIPLISHPCLVLTKGKIAGSLFNGSYQVAIAYLINGVRVTDYMGISEVQGLFSHENANSSLELKITEIDQSFDEFELVLISNINQQTTARVVGTYNTSVGTILIDRIDMEWPAVSISDIVFRSEHIEKSDAIYNVNDYALRVGAYSKFKINYQPQANRITSQWTAAKYPSDYYHKGGNNTSYLRDEVYSFFIRWIYNTGERSESYHIPGRDALPSDRELILNSDNFENDVVERWQIYNTASIDTLLSGSTSDGGILVASGKMGYWESTEKYPDDRRDIWGNLCGQRIRHHKMPDETVNPILNHFTEEGNSIVLLGVQFANIEHPVDINGQPIASIVGYEILRGSREGNKSIIAKGIVNNMREYDIPGTTTTGLYQNYPYNDLRPDILLTSNSAIVFPDEPAIVPNESDETLTVSDEDDIDTDEDEDDNLSKREQRKLRKKLREERRKERRIAKEKLNEQRQRLRDAKRENIDVNLNNPLTGYKKDYMSFHSPDVSFSNPFLSVDELKITQEVHGSALGYFEHPYKHPKFKTVTNFSAIYASIVATVAGVGTVLSAFGGDGNITLPGSEKLSYQKKLSISKVTNFPIGGGANAIGTGGFALFPYPVNATTNTIVSAYNATMAIVMSALEAQVIGEQILNVIYGMIPATQNALQYNSHGFYNQSIPKVAGSQRYRIDRAMYIGTGTYSFDEGHTINNIHRNKFVALKLNRDVADPVTTDNSRFRLAGAQRKINTKVRSRVSSHYGALKIQIPSQYGQLESIKQLPISGGCIHPAVGSSKYASGLLWGGDIYINRFTEKNTMYFFDTWLMGEPDEFEIDYRNYMSIAYPRFWINNGRNTYKLFGRASNNRHLDERTSDVFFVSRGYFYLFHSGVRDFFVESEINLAYRDWEEDIGRRHYDAFGYSGDEVLRNIFRSDVIKNGNFYKYDTSLSVSKLLNSSITWGSMLPRSYNPVVASKCFTYYPDRVYYSLPQQLENRKDNWRTWLINNYKEFPSPVTSIKPVNRTGALFMMKRQGPMQFIGAEELKLDGTGAKITIGDGGLFNQPMQNIVSTDDSFEYGSCQSRYATLNCTHGVFWVSQNQGKVFQYAGSINEISRDGMKWWFSRHLPSELLAMYPNYPFFDNPMKGVGVLMTYDNINEIIYISKRDFKPKRSDLLTDSKGIYLMQGGGGKVYLELSDTAYFEDASWTVSYDPKNKTWVSFHDWKPNFLLPSKTHFMSVKDKGIWKHNLRCDLFCNFYGVDYPFEVEFVSSTGQMVNSIRNIEYLLECYRYHNNCRDKFHALDQNFDQAMVYNSEQVSGLLEMSLKNKVNPVTYLQYPQTTLNSIRILYSKEEQKYRFNQFWDITKNRGEFSDVNIPMFNTSANGYEFSINPQYIDYQKPVLERKKFRHNVNRVWMRRVKSGDLKMLFKMSNQKTQFSMR